MSKIKTLFYKANMLIMRKIRMLQKRYHLSKIAILEDAILKKHAHYEQGLHFKDMLRMSKMILHNKRNYIANKEKHMQTKTSKLQNIFKCEENQSKIKLCN